MIRKEDIEHGVCVWAKMDSYRPWPAHISMKRKGRSSRNKSEASKKYAAFFFGDEDEFSWLDASHMLLIAPNNVCEFLRDTSTDEDFVHALRQSFADAWHPCPVCKHVFSKPEHLQGHLLRRHKDLTILQHTIDAMRRRMWVEMKVYLEHSITNSFPSAIVPELVCPSLDPPSARLVHEIVSTTLTMPFFHEEELRKEIEEERAQLDMERRVSHLRQHHENQMANALPTGHRVETTVKRKQSNYLQNRKTTKKKKKKTPTGEEGDDDEEEESAYTAQIRIGEAYQATNLPKVQKTYRVPSHHHVRAVWKPECEYPKFDMLCEFARHARGATASTGGIEFLHHFAYQAYQRGKRLAAKDTREVEAAVKMEQTQLKHMRARQQELKTNKIIQASPAPSMNGGKNTTPKDTSVTSSTGILSMTPPQPPSSATTTPTPTAPTTPTPTPTPSTPTPTTPTQTAKTDRKTRSTRKSTSATAKKNANLKSATMASSVTTIAAANATIASLTAAVRRKKRKKASIPDGVTRVLKFPVTAALQMLLGFSEDVDCDLMDATLSSTSSSSSSGGRDSLSSSSLSQGSGIDVVETKSQLSLAKMRSLMAHKSLVKYKYTGSKPFTDNEATAFNYLMQEYGKNFPLISLFFSHRRESDMIEQYYHQFKYKHPSFVRVRRAMRKRQAQIEHDIVEFGLVSECDCCGTTHTGRWHVNGATEDEKEDVCDVCFKFMQKHKKRPDKKKKEVLKKSLIPSWLEGTIPHSKAFMKEINMREAALDAEEEKNIKTVFTRQKRIIAKEKKKAKTVEPVAKRKKAEPKTSNKRKKSSRR
eukprot:m.83613 g.83613  ORF g.83613 m.83613 type:complete len:817 (-) comp12128_c0_seq1:28-2478(-)